MNRVLVIFAVLALAAVLAIIVLGLIGTAAYNRAMADLDTPEPDEGDSLDVPADSRALWREFDGAPRVPRQRDGGEPR